MHAVLPSLLLALVGTAHADPIWKRSPVPGVTAGLELAANLGPAEDRKRFGIAATMATQWLWYEEAIGWDGPSPVSPLARVSAHIGWTAPVFYVQVAAQAGAMYPLQVFDVGMIPLAGWIAGGGFGIATDGWAGPFAATTLIAPFVEGRYDLSLWKKHTHAPRLSIGLVIPVAARSEFAIDEFRSSGGGSVPPNSGAVAPGAPPSGPEPGTTPTSTP